MPSLVEIGQVVMQKKIKMQKVYRQTDDRQLEKLTWAFGSGEQTDDRQLAIRKAKLSLRFRWANNGGGGGGGGGEELLQGNPVFFWVKTKGLLD